MSILVTGGAGYIGSHTCIELLELDYEVIILDNFSNSSLKAIKTVEKITNKKIKYYEGDLNDVNLLNEIFEQNSINSVIHFAGLKSVSESNLIPLKYYENNFMGTLNLLKVMEKYGCKNLIFSSSATVYGMNGTSPIDEETPLSAINPYGRTKLFIEEMLRDLYSSNDSWNISILRYFNPIGAHFSGLLGESPSGIPNNLLPYISQVASGKLKELNVFGNDYNTIDGTGVRDYIHVVDLARGHIAALKYIEKKGGFSIFNLGTGIGTSVLEIVSMFEKVSNKEIPFKIQNRRKGDVAICFANPSKANNELAWKAKYNIERMCEDAWRWQQRFPNGF